MCITKGLCSAPCVKEQPNWPVKGTYSMFPLSLFLSFHLSSSLQSNGCQSAQLTAVSTGKQSIHRFKLPLPLSKCPLNLIPHLSLFLSVCLLLFLSLYVMLLLFFPTSPCSHSLHSSLLTSTFFFFNNDEALSCLPSFHLPFSLSRPLPPIYDDF